MVEEFKGQQAPDRLVIRTSGRLLFVHLADIDWIEAADNYVCIHAGGKSHMLSEKISALEERLDPRRFIRVHRSRMVNLDKVREVHPMFNGDYVFLLRDGTEVSSGRNYRERLRAMLTNAFLR
jgi:two-component system LytT family response regulator